MNRLTAVAFGVSFAALPLVACESKGKTEAEFCSVVKKVETAQIAVVSVLNSGQVPVPAEVKTALTVFRNALSEMADAAPGAIADDMVFVVNGFTAFDLGLQKVDSTTTACSAIPKRRKQPRPTWPRWTLPRRRLPWMSSTNSRSPSAASR